MKKIEASALENLNGGIICHPVTNLIGICNPLCYIADNYNAVFGSYGLPSMTCPLM